jgi:hypothetical protein
MVKRLLITSTSIILFLNTSLFFPSNTAKAQSSVDSLKIKIENLRSEISSLRDSISHKLSKIKSIENTLEAIEGKSAQSVWINGFKVEAYKSPNSESEMLNTLYKGAKVSVLDTTDNFFRVKFLHSTFGYVGSNEEGYIPITNNLFSKSPTSKLTPSEIRRGEGTKKNKYANLPKKLRDAILSGEVFIGMQRKWVIESIGYPDKINKTTTRYSVNEQFIYEDLNGNRKYLYIEDGILTTIQE